MQKKFAIALMAGLVLVLALAGAVFAQGATPGASTPTPGQPGAGIGKFFGGRGFGGLFSFGRGNNWQDFDLVAKTLGMTPTELFDQLHNGKTIAQIAADKKIDLATVQSALNASRSDQMKAAIEAAVTSGKMSRDQADWLLQGIDKGYLPGGRFMMPRMQKPSATPNSGTSGFRGMPGQSGFNGRGRSVPQPSLGRGA